ALLEKPSCDPHCSSLGRLFVEATPERVRLRLEASAVVATPVPLPGQAGHWLPTDVLVDGKAATALHRDGKGHLWLYLPAGGHQIVLEGPPAGGETVQISFVQKPHAAQSSLRGRTLEGVGEEGERAEP